MLVGRLNTTTHKFDVVDVPIPEPGPGQVRIKVEAAGVCLSDVHLIDGRLNFGTPKGGIVTLGHEVAGTIDVLGPAVTGWQHGQRVLLKAGERSRDNHLLTRGVDYDGGWAQYALATATTLVAIPDDLPFEQAAIIPNAVETPWGAITVTGDVRPAQAAESGASAASAPTRSSCCAWSARHRSSRSIRSPRPVHAPWSSAQTSPSTRPSPNCAKGCWRRPAVLGSASLSTLPAPHRYANKRLAVSPTTASSFWSV